MVVWNDKYIVCHDDAAIGNLLVQVNTGSLNDPQENMCSFELLCGNGIMCSHL